MAAYSHIAAYYNNRGAAYGDQGEYDAAIANYNEAIRLDSKVLIIYTNLGKAWSAKGDSERAQAAYARRVEAEKK